MLSRVNGDSRDLSCFIQLLNLGKEVNMLTIVVPFYNESEVIPTFLPKLVEFSQLSGWELVLVDDGSTDNTLQLLKEYEDPPRVRVIHHKVNRGYGGALKSGLSAVTTPFVITIDGDGQHDFNEIPKLFDFFLKTDADMVIGSRKNLQKADRYRELGKSLIRIFARIFIPIFIYDLNSGMKLYRTELVQRYLSLCPNSMAFSDIITLIFINQKHLVLEHPINVLPREKGRSTINTKTAFETVYEILNIILTFYPLRFFVPLSFLFIILGVVWGLPLMIAGRGFSIGTIFLILSGIQFLVIGLLSNQVSGLKLSILCHYKQNEQGR